MKNKISYLLLLLLASACGPDPSDEEPPFVCEGELPCLETDNSAYAAAYINGEVWESGVPPLGITHEDNSVYFQDDNRLFIHLKKFQSPASGEDHISQSIVFDLFNPKIGFENNLEYESGFYDLNSICFNGETSSSAYLIDYTYGMTHFQLLSFDVSQQTVSGYYGLRSINPYCNDTLLITDGRFNSFFTIQ